MALRKFFEYLKGYTKECVIAPLFKMLEASFELFIPLVVAAIVDTGIGNDDRPYIIRMGLIMVLLGLIGLCCAIVAQYFSARAAVGVAAGIIGNIASGAATLFDAFKTVSAGAVSDIANAIKIFVDGFDNSGAASAISGIAAKASELFKAFSGAVEGDAINYMIRHCHSSF